MSKRHTILAALAALVCVAALLQWGVLPLSAYYHGLEKDISTSRQRLQQIMELRQEYQQVRSRSGEREASGAEAGDFSLYSFLQRLAQKQDLKGSVVFMRPQTEQVSGGLTREMVHLRLGDVGMGELIPYLYHLDHADSPVRMKDMTIRSRQGSGQGLQVDLQVYVLKG